MNGPLRSFEYSEYEWPFRFETALLNKILLVETPDTSVMSRQMFLIMMTNDQDLFTLTSVKLVLSVITLVLDFSHIRSLCVIFCEIQLK